MATTKSLGQKDDLDKFYTNPDIARMCIQNIENISMFDCIIEPSAGNGSFSKQINNCMAFDIRPEDNSIQCADWFTLDKMQFQDYKNILVVGNPPFGQQNNLAIRFFNEAAHFATTIAFVLPLSFKKRSVQNKLNKYFHLKNEIVLPKNSFTLNGNNYDVPCVFQVWEKQERSREILKSKTTTELFDFVDKQNADFRIQRVGGNAGKASFDLDYSAQSNYFIKNKTDLSNEEFVRVVNQEVVFTDVEFTVGPKSLSKTELILTLEEFFKKHKNRTDE